jgi:hypothetical protein
VRFRALALVRVGLTVLLGTAGTTTAAADGDGADVRVDVVLCRVALHIDAAAGQLEALAQHQHKHHVSLTRDTHAGAGACNARMPTVADIEAEVLTDTPPLLMVQC